MAIWQFDCVVVPREPLSRLSTPIASLFLDGSEMLWQDRRAQDVALDLAGLGNPMPTWTDSLIMWGADDGTCVQLSTEGDVIDDLRIRIDLRDTEDGLLLKLLNVARERNWALVAETGEVIDPDVEAVLAAAAGSDAGRFVRDPRGFLDDVQRRKPRTE